MDVIEPKNDSGDIWPGIGLTVALHAIFAVLFFVFAGKIFKGYDVLVPLFLPGATQLIYMVPAIVIAYLTHRKGIMKGLIIGAAITILLNALCWGSLFGIGMIGR